MAKHCSRISSSVGSYASMVPQQRGHRVHWLESHLYLHATQHVVPCLSMSVLVSESYSRLLLLEHNPVALVIV